MGRKGITSTNDDRLSMFLNRGKCIYEEVGDIEEKPGRHFVKFGNGFLGMLRGVCGN